MVFIEKGVHADKAQMNSHPSVDGSQIKKIKLARISEKKRFMPTRQKNIDYFTIIQYLMLIM